MVNGSLEAANNNQYAVYQDWLSVFEKIDTSNKRPFYVGLVAAFNAGTKPFLENTSNTDKINTIGSYGHALSELDEVTAVGYMYLAKDILKKGEDQSLIQFGDRLLELHKEQRHNEYLDLIVELYSSTKEKDIPFLINSSLDELNQTHIKKQEDHIRENKKKKRNGVKDYLQKARVLDKLSNGTPFQRKISKYWDAVMSLAYEVNHGVAPAFFSEDEVEWYFEKTESRVPHKEKIKLGEDAQSLLLVTTGTSVATSLIASATAYLSEKLNYIGIKPWVYQVTSFAEEEILEQAPNHADPMLWVIAAGALAVPFITYKGIKSWKKRKIKKHYNYDSFSEVFDAFGSNIQQIYPEVLSAYQEVMQENGTDAGLRPCTLK